MSTLRRNYLVYFYGYFATQVIFVFINVFLPVYFFNILKVNRTELAFVQILSYSVLLLKPFISIYFDKPHALKKSSIIISSVGIVISFLLFIINLNFLIIFGIFLSINFICLSVMDVVIDKLIVINSPDEKAKDRNALCVQLGAMTGAIVPVIISYLIFTDIYSRSIWNQFFLIGISLVIPLIFISFLLKDDSEVKQEPEMVSNKDIDKKSIILMSIFLFLAYSDNLFQYPFEPWVLERYGAENFSLFLLYLVILIFLNALGVIMAGLISNKYDRKKIIIISSLSSGILLIIIPFTDFITFFILLGILQVIGGFILINIIALMIDKSQKKVMQYQIMAAFVILAKIIFVGLGTYLSARIPTEYIVVISGILIILSVIPILFLEGNERVL